MLHPSVLLIFHLLFISYISIHVISCSDSIRFQYFWASASSFWSHGFCSSWPTRCSKTSQDAASILVDLGQLSWPSPKYAKMRCVLLCIYPGGSLEDSAMKVTYRITPCDKTFLSERHFSLWHVFPQNVTFPRMCRDRRDCHRQDTSKVGLPGVSCQRLEHHSADLRAEKVWACGKTLRKTMETSPFFCG